MSAVRDALKSIRATVLESCGEENTTAHQALLQISLVALRELESTSRADEREDCAEAAKRARKELKRFRKETDNAVGEKHARSEEEVPSGSGAKTSPSASPDQEDGSSLRLGQYATTDAFDGNERKKSKFARLLGGGKATAVAQTHNTVAASTSAVKEMNRVLENQFEDAIRRGRKKGLGA